MPDSEENVNTSDLSASPFDTWFGRQSHQGEANSQVIEEHDPDIGPMHVTPTSPAPAPVPLRPVSDPVAPSEAPAKAEAPGAPDSGPQGPPLAAIEGPASVEGAPLAATSPGSSAPAGPWGVCTGTGNFETHKADGQPYRTLCLDEIQAVVENPPRGVAKGEGGWIIPSTYCDNDARSSLAQRERGKFAMLALDVDSGNPSLQDVERALAGVLGSCGYLIYSTASATEELCKWRALIPLAAPLPGADYSETQRAFFDLLAGVGLVPDRALERPAQVSYLPAPRGAFYMRQINDAAPLALTADHPIVQRREATRVLEAEAKAAADARRAERAQARASGAMTMIEAFNAVHPLADMLRRCGYEPQDPEDDGPGSRWRSRYQGSGSHATRLMQGDDGAEYWTSLSASDAAEGIGSASRGGHRFGDAFDLFLHFGHGGDAEAAKAAALALPEVAQRLSAARAASAEAAFARAVPLDQPAPAAQAPKAFRFVRVADMVSRPPSFLIRPLLEEGVMSCLFGDPSAGKSFNAIHMACCVATGTPFFGMSVKQGPVIYLAGEGHSGLKRRTVAWEIETGVSLAGAALDFVVQPAQMLDPAHADQVAVAVRAIAAVSGEPRLIVIDTLARNFGPGDENKTQDMNRFVAAVDTLKSEYPDCTVLIVHHTGHANKERARGALSLYAALDAEYRLEVDAGGTRSLVNTKMKDARIAETLHFKLKDVTLGLDDENRPFGSAVLVQVGAPVTKPDKQPKWTTQCLDAFEHLDPELNLRIDGVVCRPLKAAKQAFKERVQPELGEGEKKGKGDSWETTAWARAFKHAKDNGLLVPAPDTAPPGYFVLNRYPSGWIPDAAGVVDDQEEEE